MVTSTDLDMLEIWCKEFRTGTVTLSVHVVNR